MDLIYPILTTIRSSGLSRYPDCPRRWAAQSLRREIEEAGHVLGIPRETIAGPIGSAVHAGAAALLKAKMDGSYVGLSDATDAALAELDGLVADVDIFYDPETAPTIPVARRQVARMLHAYARQIVPQVDPIVVEERLEANCCWDSDGNPSLLLSGQCDNLCRSPSGLRDIKTGGKAGARANHKPQVGSYSLLFRSHGIDVNEVLIDFIPRVAITTPQPPVVTTTYNVAACETAARRIIDHISRDLSLFREGDLDLRRIEAGDPWAFVANPSSMMCNQKWCPAHGTDFCSEYTRI